MKEYIKAFIEWLKYKFNREFVTWTRGAGYYHCVVGNRYSFQMESGREAIFKCVDVDYFFDPSDMIQKAHYHIIQYAGEKTPKECTFKEFCNIYRINSK